MTMACCMCQSHALGTSSRLPRPSATPSGAKPNSCVEVFPCVARFSLMSTLHSAKRPLPSVSAITCEAWAGPLRNDRNRIVHVGARIAALAGPGEILVSRTIKDLVAGSSLRLESQGTHQLKGVPESWEVFAVMP